MKLYQFAVILHPTDKEKKDGKRSELLVDLKTILAASDQEAMIYAARSIPETHLDKLDRCEVAVRPF